MVAAPRKSQIQLGLCILIAFVLLHTAVEAVSLGWYRWIPGMMSRSRDAMAVAITEVAYGKWQGYASYRQVNRVLRERGLSVQTKDIAHVEANNYLDVMADPERVDAALKAASTLGNPAAEGMYYSQDEKGLAAFYTVAFALFGISSASWFWLYISLYSVSVLATCVAFRRQSEVLFFLLAVVCAHDLVANVLPFLPRQDLMLIHSSRFLGIMASVAMFHLMFLMLQRRRLTIGAIAAAALQVGIICLVINARTSAAWVAIAVTLLWIALWLGWAWCKHYKLQMAKPTSWPMVVLTAGIIILGFHQRFGMDPAFHDGRAQSGHVLWHNLVTALHNNPLRTERYGIPAEFPVYDDQVSYLLFDREIAKRGDNRSNYLMGNSDWVYRTTSPDLDFRWDVYDRVLRDMFLHTVVSDPWYSAYSFLVQQPKSALIILFDRDFLRSPHLFNIVPLLALVCGLLLTMLTIPLRLTMNYVPVLAGASFSVILPVLCAAVVELRVIEIYYILLLIIILAAAIVVTASGRLILRLYYADIARWFE